VAPPTGAPPSSTTLIVAAAAARSRRITGSVLSVTRTVSGPPAPAGARATSVYGRPTSLSKAKLPSASVTTTRGGLADSTTVAPPTGSSPSSITWPSSRSAPTGSSSTRSGASAPALLTLPALAALGGRGPVGVLAGAALPTVGTRGRSAPPRRHTKIATAAAAARTATRMRLRRAAVTARTIPGGATDIHVAARSFDAVRHAIVGEIAGENRMHVRRRSRSRARGRGYCAVRSFRVKCPGRPGARAATSFVKGSNSDEAPSDRFVPRLHHPLGFAHRLRRR
jgi:hypothetical protein